MRVFQSNVILENGKEREKEVGNIFRDKLMISICPHLLPL